MTKSLRLPGSWPSSPFYRPQLSTKGATKRAKNSEANNDFLSWCGGEARVLTTPFLPSKDGWNWRHSVTASRRNEAKHGTFREYFDRPRPSSSMGPARSGLRIPTAFGRTTLQPLNEKANEMPPSPSPLSPGCHARGRLDRGSADYIYDGSLALSMHHKPPIETAPPSRGALRAQRILHKTGRGAWTIPSFRNDAAWDNRWPAHDVATRVTDKDQDPFNQGDAVRPEAVGAPRRCHPLPQSCGASMQCESGCNSTTIQSKEGMLYWKAGDVDVKELVPLQRMCQVKPWDILNDAQNGTAPKVEPKLEKRRSLLHTPFTGI